MYTHLCHFLQRSLQRRPNPEKRATTPRSTPPAPGKKGQVLVLFVVSLIALILFVGLAIDSGVVYVSYGQLKRAIDASVVAAANDFKRGSTIESMTESAREILRLHNVDLDTVDVTLLICDGNTAIGGAKDGLRDPELQAVAPSFYQRCPDVAGSETPRKLVFVRATQHTPFYFLTLLGFHAIDLTTDATAEAAPVDLVIVLDVSESMASDTMDQICAPFKAASKSCPIIDDYSPDGTNQAVFDGGQPNGIGSGTINGCNTNNSCFPLQDAKTAAKALISTLYDGYDQVSIVTFDSQAVVKPIKNKVGATVNLSNDLGQATGAVDTIKLHDDPPLRRLMPNWYNPGRFNPVFPDDRDGDSSDADRVDLYGSGNQCPPTNDPVNYPEMNDRWWSTAEGAPDPYGWGGLPCDNDNLLDAFDWNKDGKYNPADDPTPGDKSEDQLSKDWMTLNGTNTLPTLSTCTGCGIRTAADVLKESGRPGAVWVVVLLSDGFANMSDSNATNPNIPTQNTNSFCMGTFNDSVISDGSKPFGFWSSYCIDYVFTPRYCLDKDSADGATDNAAATCPPDSPNDVPPNTVTWDGMTATTLHYSPVDYARDMTDEAALLRSTNLKEPSGNDIAIYTIALGTAGNNYIRTKPTTVDYGPLGAYLLRYMASVGDDGDRTTNPCRTISDPKKQCGQYYYAPSGAELLPIFEDIASRIYTRINE